MRSHINKQVIEKARRDAAAGVVREIADTECPGLVLRVQPTGLVWQARVQHERKARRVALGPVDLWPIPWARDTVREVRWHITSGHGVPDAAWIKGALDRHRWREDRDRAERDGGDPGPRPPRPQVMPKAEAVGTWTFAQARTAWTEHLQAEVAAGNLSAPTVRNYRTAMATPALRRVLDARPVAGIESADIAEVVTALTKAGKRSTAADVVRVGKRMWAWLADPAQERRSGVKPDAMARLTAPKLGSVKKRQHFPGMGELGLIVATARSGALKPVVGAAIELLIWTGQRRLSLVTARFADFGPWSEREGWGLWRCQHRKTPRAKATGTPHVIPLPPAVWARLQFYLASLPEGTEFAFPQRRPRRAGDDRPWTHIGPDTISHTLPAIPGSESSPHDARRGMASALQDKGGQHEALVGMILDHARADRTRDESGMTRRYTEAEMLSWKAPVMAAWEALLEPAVAAAVLLPTAELKAELVRCRAEQRGVDPARDRQRKRAA